MNARRPCAREHCPGSTPTRGKHAKQGYCCRGCSAVDGSLTYAEQVCREIGTGPQARELWVAAVTLNDAQTEYRRMLARARRVRGR